VTPGQNGNITVTTAGNTQNRAIAAVTLANTVNAPEAVVLTEGEEGNTQITDDITTLTPNAVIFSNTYSRRNNDIVPLGLGHTELTPPNLVPNEAEWGIGIINTGSAGTFTGIGYALNPAQNSQLAQMLVAFRQAGQSISMDYTVPSGVGDDLVLVVVGGAEDGLAPFVPNNTLPTGATFNGRPMNVVTTVNALSANNYEAGLGMFWLDVVAGESGTIVVNFTGGVDDRTLHAFTLSNAAQQAPEASAVNTDNNGGTSLTANITTLTNGAMVVSGAYQGNPSALTAIGSGHVRDDLRISSSSAGAMGHRPVPTAGPVTGTGYSAAFNRMVLILAAFRPSFLPCP